jgi:hypothetical protein
MLHTNSFTAVIYYILESLSWRVNSLMMVMLCFVDRISLYNLVNKPNLVHNLFLVYLSISTCFGRLCVHHQGKNCFYATLGTCYSVWIASTKCRINTVVSPDDGHIVARNT